MTATPLSLKIPPETIAPLENNPGAFTHPWRRWLQNIGQTAAAAGSVSSISITSPGGTLGVSGSPITSSGTIALNVISAPKWTTARALSWTGDATGTMSVDGSAGVSSGLTLATVNGAPGSYALASVTVNAKGLVTAASAASTTGAGSVVLALAPTISKPVLVGITSGATASAGNVGEYVPLNVPPSPGVALANNVAANVGSIALTAGCWMIWGNVGFLPGGAYSTFSVQEGWISTVSATAPADANNGAYALSNPPAGSGGGFTVLAGLQRYLNISSPTTVYLSSRSSWTGGTMTANGFIAALRVQT